MHWLFPASEAASQVTSDSGFACVLLPVGSDDTNNAEAPVVEYARKTIKSWLLSVLQLGGSAGSASH